MDALDEQTVRHLLLNGRVFLFDFSFRDVFFFSAFRVSYYFLARGRRERCNSAKRGQHIRKLDPDRVSGHVCASQRHRMKTAFAA